MTTAVSPSPAVSPRVQLTVRQRACLEQLVRRQTSPQRLVRRAKMLLALETGVNPCHVMRQMHLNRGTVPVWCRRWGTLVPTLEQMEADAGRDQALTTMMVQAVADHPRAGTPPPLRRNRLSRLSPWRVQTRRIPGGPSAMGRLVKSPRRSANEGLWRP